MMIRRGTEYKATSFKSGVGGRNNERLDAKSRRG